MSTSNPPASKALESRAAKRTSSPRRKRAIVLAGAILAAVAGFVSWRILRAPKDAAPDAAAQDPAAQEVSAGIAAPTPTDAIAHFQNALAISPNHYGATFQLARALENAHRKDEALPVWERVLRMAEQYGDEPIAATARARIAAAKLADPMQAGIDALYVKRDPAAAAARFLEVLAKNPEHYGATYQLAVALDQQNRPNESRPLWEKTQRMAEAIGDAPTSAKARARLAEIDAGGDPQSSSMRAGVDLLYDKHDPAAAAAEFRNVLAKEPEHYGATYQLAVALDQQNKPSESRPLWEKVQRMADAIGDAATSAKARARLEEIGAASDPEFSTMHAGVDLLYNKHDPAAAAAVFRKVLAKSPEHFGATYQLAVALDQDNKPLEARPLWVKVQKLAEANGDAATLAKARARLAQRP